MIKLPVTCTLCGQELTGPHHLNRWGERFCIDHVQELASCAYCGRLVPHTTKRDRRRSVEDISCDVCGRTAVTDESEAKLLLPELMAWAESEGVRFRQKSFRLEVVDRAEFNTREGGRRDPLGLTTSTRYLRHKRVDHAELVGVAILNGLPRTLFAGVCIHELGHVWLLQQNVLNLSPLDEEGFCELLAHHHYLSVATPADLFYARRIAENNHPIYGDGFRKLKKLEERVTFAQIIKSLLRKKKLPL